MLQQGPRLPSLVLEVPCAVGSLCSRSQEEVRDYLKLTRRGGAGQPGAQPCSLLGGGLGGTRSWVASARRLGGRCWSTGAALEPEPWRTRGAEGSEHRTSSLRSWAWAVRALLPGHGLRLKLGSASSEQRVQDWARGGGPRRRVPGLSLHHRGADLWVGGRRLLCPGLVALGRLYSPVGRMHF